MKQQSTRKHVKYQQASNTHAAKQQRNQQGNDTQPTTNGKIKKRPNIKQQNQTKDTERQPIVKQLASKKNLMKKTLKISFLNQKYL